MDQNLAVGLAAIAIMIVALMGISVQESIEMADRGLQQCRVRTPTGYTIVWQKTCQDSQSG